MSKQVIRFSREQLDQDRNKVAAQFLDGLARKLPGDQGQSFLRRPGAQGTRCRISDFLDAVRGLTLEKLLNPDVTSVSRDAESSFDAAAIYVISNEDIRRSGAPSLRTSTSQWWDRICPKPLRDEFRSTFAIETEGSPIERGFYLQGTVRF